MANGQRVPQGYLDRPEIPSELSHVLEAFWVLCSDRSIGMGMGPIPFSAIDRYAIRYGIDDQDEFEWFRSLIQTLDGEYLRIINAQKEQTADGES